MRIAVHFAIQQKQTQCKATILQDKSFYRKEDGAKMSLAKEKKRIF